MSGGGRLNRLLDLDLDDSVPDSRARARSGTTASTSAATTPSPTAFVPPARSHVDETAISIQKLCLRAERQGASGWSQALPQLTEFVRSSPQDPEAWVSLARARAALGDERDAIRAASEAVRLDPDIQLGYRLSLLVAKQDCEARRWQAAAKHAEAALASQPGEPTGLELLVRALSAQGLDERAEATLGVLGQVDAKRGFEVARELAGQSAAMAHRYRWLTKAATLAETCGSDAFSSVAKELGMEVCVQLQKDDEAASWLQKVLKHSGRKVDADVVKTLAQLHLRAGKTRDALEVYKAALAADPSSLAMLRGYGQLLMKEGRTEEAIQALKQGARLAPGPEAAALHSTLAELYQSIGQAEEAQKSWEAAASLGGDSPQNWRRLLSTATSGGNEAAERKALQNLVLLEPENCEWHARLGALKLAAAKDRDAELEAAESFRRALRINPTQGLALTKLAQICSKGTKEEREKALDLFERAARADPNSEEALEGAAAARWAREDLREAAAWDKALLQLRPGHSLALVRRARASLKDSEPGEALRLLQQATERNAELKLLLAYTNLAIGRPSEAVSVLRQMAGQPQAQLLLAMALEEDGDSAGAQKEIAALAQSAADLSESLRKVFDDPAVLVVLSRGRAEEAGLGELMPGAPVRLCKLIDTLVQRNKNASAPKSAPAAVHVEQPKPTASDVPASERWRSTLQPGTPVEVYSRSAGVWSKGEVLEVSGDMVKVSYHVDTQRCEKALLLSSENLRLAQTSTSNEGEGQRRAWHAPAPAAAPERRQWTQPQPEAEPVRRNWTTPAPAPAPPPPKLPAEASNSILLDPEDLEFGTVLGSGGFGAVYRGKYMGQEVAIKKLHAVDGQLSPLQLEEFKQEVENLQALRHPRLIAFIGAAFMAPSLCIVTEFMPNGSLYDLLHTKKAELEFVKRLTMATQISEGVEFLHGKSPPFVHRDLKSLNAILDFDLNVKLCDFGLTQSMEKTHISRRDNEGGSPRYMAPELFDCRGKITEKVDVWALGCMVLEIITSKLPHEECTSIQQVMSKTLVQKELPFEWTGIRDDIRRIAEPCFDYDVSQRISAKILLEGLRQVR